jgi:hypothetical protein
MFALSSENRFHLNSQPTDTFLSGQEGANKFQWSEWFGAKYPWPESLQWRCIYCIKKLRDKIKLLPWQRTIFILYYIRLKKGTFELLRYESSARCTFTHAGCNSILRGLSVSIAFAFSVESRKPIID